MTTPQGAATRALATASFLFGGAPAARYVAPALADWVAEHGAATTRTRRFWLGVRYAAALAFTFAFLISRVERDGALARAWPPLVVAAPGLFALRAENVAASQALWLSIGVVVFFAIAAVPAAHLVRASRVAPGLSACVAACAAWSGSGYWRIPLVDLVVAPAELVKPVLVLAVVGVVAARGRARVVHGVTLALALGLGVLAFARTAPASPVAPAMHTDLVLASVWRHAGALGVVALLLGFGALAFGLQQAARGSKGPASIGAGALLAMLGVEAALHVGGELGLLPVLGVPLAFVSYGGSAIVGTFAAVGVVHALFRAGLRRPDSKGVARR